MHDGSDDDVNSLLVLREGDGDDGGTVRAGRRAICDCALRNLAPNAFVEDVRYSRAGDGADAGTRPGHVQHGKDKDEGEGEKEHCARRQRGGDEEPTTTETERASRAEERI